MLLVGPSGTAGAATTTSGEDDTTTPLVIDPSSDPTGAVTTERTGYARVAYIVKMPVTKRVVRVTLGNFARGSSCAVNTGLRLSVREHASDYTGDSKQITYTEAFQPVDAILGKVTWTIPATTLSKGRGYSFTVNPDSSKCNSWRHEQWAHNSPKVDNTPTTNGTADTTPARCAASPSTRSDGSDVYPLQRMWHSAGASDRDAKCVTNLNDWAFSPSMPEGWLVTRQASSTSYVLGGSNWTSPPPADSACTTAGAAAGATVVYWRPSPNRTDGVSDYVCMWPQYNPLIERTASGWYYGTPWPANGTAAPVDSYIKLEPATYDYDALLQKHAPVLKFDLDDSYRADSPAMMADSYAAGLNFRGQAVSEGPPGLQELGPTYPNYPDSPPSTDDFLDLGDHDQDTFKAIYANTSAEHPDFLYHAYGRPAQDDQGRIWLQYWLFYFNQDSIGSFAEHQGDWEWIQVRLDGNQRPDVAAYAQHGDGTCRTWASVEHGWSPDRPDVYVAQTTHASYFSPGWQSNVQDRADGDAEALIPSLTQFSPTGTRWRDWPGRWGGTDGVTATSPTGPGQGQNATAWDDPAGWARGLPTQSNPC